MTWAVVVVQLVFENSEFKPNIDIQKFILCIFITRFEIPDLPVKIKKKIIYSTSYVLNRPFLKSALLNLVTINCFHVKAC